MQARLEVNPLRLFDTKDEGVQELLTEFKPISSVLCEGCREHYRTVRGTLDELEVPNREDPGLVRGLDYYCRTTFEIKAQDGRKTSSLAGGGRYDYLVEQCGGPSTPAVGFSIGIERTLLHLNDEAIDPQRSRQSTVDVYVACRGEAAERYGLVASDLLRGFCRLEVDTSGRSLKAQAKSANLRGAKILLVVGDEELDSGSLQMKNLENGEQNPVDRGALLAVVRKALEG